MKNMLYILAIVFAVFWAIGYFGYHTGRNTHILLAIAILLISIQVIKKSRVS